MGQLDRMQLTEYSNNIAEWVVRKKMQKRSSLDSFSPQSNQYNVPRRTNLTSRDTVPTFEDSFVPEVKHNFRSVSFASGVS